ncbi:MAG: DUF1801 domain-containing protein [Bacteroidetes bacterium]|nr:DUF1801 domain-containing protein [Bacteroidota bacterium]
MEKIKDVDVYISSFQEPQQRHLIALRKLILDLAPDAEECINYNMPAYKTYKRPLVYFAAFSRHVGLYATPSGQNAFKKELKGYKQGKGSIQFPIDKELPLQLIRKIVQYRIDENHARFAK